MASKLGQPKGRAAQSESTKTILDHEFQSNLRGDPVGLGFGKLDGSFPGQQLSLFG